MEELIKQIKDWAKSRNGYLSSSTEYANGYREAVRNTKWEVLEIIEEYEKNKQQKNINNNEKKN